MGNSTKNIRQSVTFVSVFQHHADIIESENVRKTIIETLRQCLDSRQPILVFPLRLYYGNCNLRGRRDFRATLDELAWKRSELTGKFCGCPFWSVKAKTLFDQKLAGYVKGRTPTLHDAWQIADGLSKKTAKSDQKLTHEHVFPRAHLLDLLRELDCPSKFDFIEAQIEKLAIGCVVLQSEHELLEARKGDQCNPWLRYKGVIRLAENQEWPDFQRRMIREARLLEER